jgi:membrane-associated phospholipid phosphatase
MELRLVYNAGVSAVYDIYMSIRHGVRERASVAGMVIILSSTATALKASDAIETAGDILQFALPVTAAGLTLAYWDGKGAIQFGESAGVTVGVTYALKYTVNETRPNGGHQSFPSGHTSISFSAAEFMRKRYGWGYGVPAYMAAAFVAYSRVEANEHYPHDVIAGAAIGIASSFIFTTPYHGWHVQAEADGRYWGIRLSRSI